METLDTTRLQEASLTVFMNKLGYTPQTTCGGGFVKYDNTHIGVREISSQDAVSLHNNFGIYKTKYTPYGEAYLVLGASLEKLYIDPALHSKALKEKLVERVYLQFPKPPRGQRYSIVQNQMVRFTRNASTLEGISVIRHWCGRKFDHLI
ncbi:hypothetical protein [Vibrio phage RYC]|nr:hypothetical protein [Vibrio phage RYC]